MKSWLTSQKNNMKEFLKSNKVRAFGWTTANGVIALTVMYLTDINWAYAPIVIAGLNMLTKEINKRYL